jgi:Leucine-rich repeat (LRR) protein
MGADEYVDTDGDQMADSWEVDNFGDLSHDGTVDTDVDGLTDLEEFQHGTDPNVWDTEGDGMPDGWEVDNSLNPLVDDSGQDGDGDGLNNLYEYGWRYNVVFVTSEQGTGALGNWTVILGEGKTGLEAADAICQALADDAPLPLPGRFKAWLSDSSTHASVRLTHSTVPYVRVDGVVVADNWDDLFDIDYIDAPINVTELNTTLSGDNIYVWTATHNHGYSWGSNCGNWTVGTSPSEGRVGNATYDNYFWTNTLNSLCSNDNYLYCFQQNGYPASTDPNNTDSDSDGLYDGDEVNIHNTNPTNFDTDGDGLSDGDEVNIHNTHPNNPDTDGDYRNDGREVAKGTLPNDDTDFSGVPDIEWSALVDLYNSTNGDGWSDKTNWLDDSVSECTWNGVNCDGTNNVIRLILNSNNLIGTIPASLGNFAFLEGLWLQWNDLSGPIPPALENLTSLEGLYLAGNQLTGSIPPELGNLGQLGSINLGQNQLSGLIPPALGNLTLLGSLELSINELNGPIPAALSNLTALTHLYLNINQLSGSIPLELGSLANLQVLALDNNQLSGAIPPQLGSLANLHVLNLRGNQLSGSVPPELGSLNNLWHLFLSSNQLSGPIPPELGNLTLLSSLELSNNQLSGSIPAALGSLTYLERLDLAENQLSGTILPELGNLTYLRRLYLRSNQLSGTIPPELGSLANLQYLRLSSNKLSGPIPTALKDLILEQDGSDFRWNALYADSNDPYYSDLIALLTYAQWEDDWENTQTVAPTDLTVGTITATSVQLNWTPILYTADFGFYQFCVAATSQGPCLSYSVETGKASSTDLVGGLTPDKEYFFRGQTVTNPHGANQNQVHSEFSLEVSAKTLLSPTPLDNDGDGYTGSVYGGDDCDDVNPLINPGATDIANNGIDENCDGSDFHIDTDWDGILDTEDDSDVDVGGVSEPDGVMDDVDNCFYDYNPLQENLDGDEFGDACDDSDYDGQVDDPLVDPFPFDDLNDIDEDGIGADTVDRCGYLGVVVCGIIDNCPVTPNGPNLGTCTAGNVGAPCTSDVNCGSGGYCSMNQEDEDLDGIGDACESLGAVAPEPKCNPRREVCTPADEIPDGDNDGLPDTDEPAGCENDSDCDDDTIADGEDNCIQTANLNQTDTDNDGQGDACDADDDNDDVADGTDNCPLVANYDQSNMDGDPDGDACDTDIDGDTIDNDVEIQNGTSPTNPDTDGDGLPDNTDPDPLNPATDPKYTIEFALEVADSQISTDSWLPSPPPSYPALSEPVIPAVVQSSQVRVVAILKDPAGDTTAFTGDVTFTLNPSTWEGVATNDTEVYVDAPSNDYSFHDTNKDYLTETVAAGGNTEAPVDLYSFDYGGQATITATTVAPDNSVVQDTITLPLDSDNDLLPDIWENSMAGFNPYDTHSFGATLDDGQEDIDTSINNQYDGDGLTNFREFRGIILDNLDGLIVEKHVRLDPFSKDLFVRGDGFANSINPPSNPTDVLDFSVVVPGGSAFENAGIVVHDVTQRLSFNGLGEPPNIDILVVTNDTENTPTIAGYANGWTNHLGARYWTWDTKGASYIGDFQFYQLNSATGAQGTYLYHKNLMHYIYNRPYWNEPDPAPQDPNVGPLNPDYLNLLDPLDLVEDYNQENGIGPEVIKGKSEDRFIVNEVLDGDHMQTDWKTHIAQGAESYMAGYQFSCFDADGDHLVENPVWGDPLGLTSGKDPGEYEADQLQLHTAIHEMGHAVGIAEHTTDALCAMFQDSQNWDRAGYFCDFAKSQIMIHNKTE